MTLAVVEGLRVDHEQLQEAESGRFDPVEDVVVSVAFDVDVVDLDQAIPAAES